ncbi:hypothetical protein ACFQV8_17585 [Pseudonocardia benzenivorans]
MKKGDIVRITTPGGGGWGDPLKRDPEAVRLDVHRALVSPESARDDYGVVLVDSDDPRHPIAVDTEATADRRRELAANRAPLKLIDRGEAFNKMVEEGLIEVSDYDDLAYDENGNPVG